MTHEQKIKYFKIAASICNLGFDEQQVDLLVSQYDLVLEEGGSGTLDQIIRIKEEVRQRHMKRLADETEQLLQNEIPIPSK